MIHRMARLARKRVATVAAGLLLAVGGLAALPAPPASAGSVVTAVVNFGTPSYPDNAYVTMSCGTSAAYYYPANVVQVYNPCSHRVWIHYISGSSVQAYCVNPGGAIAYDFPIHYASGDTVNIQVTTNPYQCDSAGGKIFGFAVTWLMGASSDEVPYPCQMGRIAYDPGLAAVQVISACNVRIWLHATVSGGNPAVCINPHTTYVPSNMYEFYQAQVTYNQAPCSAGGSPYPMT